MTENVNYSIDDKQAVAIGSRQFEFEHSNQIVSINTEATVDISNLTAGEHLLNLSVSGICNIGNDFLKPYNAIFSPIHLCWYLSHSSL